jgi:hypothetical protein
VISLGNCKISKERRNWEICGQIYLSLPTRRVFNSINCKETPATESSNGQSMFINNILYVSFMTRTNLSRFSPRFGIIKQATQILHLLKIFISKISLQLALDSYFASRPHPRMSSYISKYLKNTLIV